MEFRARARERARNGTIILHNPNRNAFLETVSGGALCDAQITALKEVVSPTDQSA
jgi:hypothetical protein